MGENQSVLRSSGCPDHSKKIICRVPIRGGPRRAKSNYPNSGFMSLSLVVLLLLKASSAVPNTATAASRAVQLVSEIASTHPSAAVIALAERPGAVSVATDVARIGRV